MLIVNKGRTKDFLSARRCGNSFFTLFLFLKIITAMNVYVIMNRCKFKKKSQFITQNLISLISMQSSSSVVNFTSRCGTRSRPTHPI